MSLSRRFAKELKSRKPDCSLPLLFLNGEYLGVCPLFGSFLDVWLRVLTSYTQGAKEIEELNENDELTTVLEKVPVQRRHL